MVTTKIFDMASKISEWTYGGRQDNAPATTSTTAPPSRSSGRFPSATANSQGARSSSSSSTNSYWNYANIKIKGAAEEAYSSVAGMVSNALYKDGATTQKFEKKPWYSWQNDVRGGGAFPHLKNPKRSSTRRSTSISARDLTIMFENPYVHVRGSRSQQSSYSVSSIRSLLALVPQTMSQDENTGMSSRVVPTDDHDEYDHDHDMDESWTAATPDKCRRSGDISFSSHPPFVSSAETASQIAEGVIRALRDLALDEADELHNALRFWSERWERPLLSWLEAGPQVWMQPGGYNHQVVGRKVAQIQAILARRCASIGELQTHLLRAGWHKGVAQWGVLGDGGEWAAVAGFDGFSGDSENRQAIARARTRTLSSNDVRASRSGAKKSAVGFDLDDESNRDASTPIESTMSGQSDAEANIFVEMCAGGGLVVDDPAFLSEWSVEGIKLVRQQLARSAGKSARLPFDDQWTRSSSKDVGELVVQGDELCAMPSWAMEMTMPVGGFETTAETRTEMSVVDLSAMVEEVSELVDVMEPIMNTQRRRRLDVLQPPTWIRRNWFVITTAGPLVTYVAYQMLRNKNAKATYSNLADKVKNFCRERIQEPVAAIIQELWKGRAPFSDREARLEAIESLKKMIRNWLDDNHPDLSLDERESLAAKMDVTLIEKQKVESMKTFYELNKVIQMSFIEMQYMKKEMLNALEAIDQMMSANDINMQVAAIAPVAMLVYVSSKLFRFIYYALLKIGKSREDTYASLRSILTDVERLLVMRDNPPQPPPLPGRQKRGSRDLPLVSTVLNPDDLGMLMLLLHGCRQILWNEHRRFPSETVRSISEDLAELSGERGPVSVQQQLLILSRMSRTYPFLKVVSTGIMSSAGLVR